MVTTSTKTFLRPTQIHTEISTEMMALDSMATTKATNTMNMAINQVTTISSYPSPSLTSFTMDATFIVASRPLRHEACEAREPHAPEPHQHEAAV